MKILFLVNIPSPYRVDFFNELGKTCDLTVAFEGMYATDRDKEWKGNDPENFKPVYLQGIRIRTEAFLCLDVFSVLKKGWDAIVIGGYSTPTMMLSIEYLRMHKIPFYLEVDGGFIKEESRLKYWIKHHYVSAASAWFSTGKKTSEFLLHYGAKRDKIYLYPFTSLRNEDFIGAYTMSEAKPTESYIEFLRKHEDDWKKNRCMIKDDARDKLGIYEKKIVLAVGRFVYKKGFDILLNASEFLDSSIGIYILGGQTPTEYVKIIEQKKLKNVHIIGFKGKEELSLYYKMADLFVLPTREDIWGLVVNEAMSYGLPVITTNMSIAGMELIRQYENGCIVPSDDVDELAKAIKKVLEMDYNQDMSFNAFCDICDYTIENMAACHMKIMEAENLEK